MLRVKPPAWVEEAQVHALGWLAAGNLAGLVLAAMLLFPPLGDLSGPLTYGRWAAVHIDLAIYGWCSLPLLALLFHLYEPPSGDADGGGRIATWAIRWWSGALAFQAVSSLTGHSSGKVFAEWSGASRWVFLSAWIFAAVAVIAGFARRFRARGRGELAESRLSLAAKGLGLAFLTAAPPALFFAASPGLYPPINPESGGATSGNTLASVLGVALLLALTPFLTGLRPRDGGRFSFFVFAALAGHFVFLALLGGGDHSHREPLQVAALFSSLLWLPLLFEHWRRFAWPARSRRWVWAMAAWGLVLASTGLLAGAPGMAERIKYTNTLVGHVHAAVAGLTTAWLFVLLDQIAERRGLGAAGRSLFADRPAFAAWQLGSVLQVCALSLVGQAEAGSPQILWSGAAVVSWGYGLRFAGGLLMASAAWRWLRAASNSVAAAPAEEVSHEILVADLLPGSRLG